MSLIKLVTEAEIAEGRELTEKIAELLGGRDFVLILDADPAGDVAGDIYSNVSNGHDLITLLESALASCREERKEAAI